MPKKKPAITAPPATPEAPKKHLFVSVLVGGGQVFEWHAQCRESLRTLCAKERVDLTISRNASTGVDRARNQEIAKAFAITDRPFTDFMFIDADIVFDPKWVLDMVYTDADIIAGAYPRKGIDWDRVAAAVKAGVKDEDLPKHATTFIINGWAGKGFVNSNGTFAEVREAGTGFMLIKRATLERFIDAYREDIAYLTDYEPRDVVHHMVFKGDRDFQCDIEQAISALKHAAEGVDEDAILAAVRGYKAALLAGDKALGRYLTEDYGFCRRAAAIGMKTYIYLDAALKHIGLMTYEGEINKGLVITETPAAEEAAQ